MTKNILGSALLTLTLFGASSASAWTIRTTIGGGPSGYNATQRQQDNAGNVTISCSGAGYDSCPSNVVKPGDQAGLDYALNAIANGTLSGTWSDPTNGTTTTWSASSSAGTTSDIRVTGD